MQTTGRRARCATFYLFRTGFSALWVTLVYWLASVPSGEGTISVLGGPWWTSTPVSDAVGTLFDLRSGSIATRWLHHLNLAADLAAALTILVALWSSLASAITVFGVWAIGTGAVMISLAARRQEIVRVQRLMIISGSGSVIAGTTFASWTGSPSAGLAVLGRYSAGGAVWYLLAAALPSWTAHSGRK